MNRLLMTAAGLALVASLAGWPRTVAAQVVSGKAASTTQSGATGSRVGMGVQPAAQAKRLPMPTTEEFVRMTASARVEYGSPRFVLKLGEKPFGPFKYEPMTAVDLGSAGSYDVMPLSGGRFSMKSMTGGQTNGPFACREGTQIALGSNTYTLAMAPLDIKGVFRLQRSAPSGIPVSLIEVTPAMIQDTVRLRSTFRSFEREAAAQKAPRKVPTPAVSGPPDYNRSPVVRPSRHARVSADAAIEQRSQSEFDKFMRKHRCRYINPSGTGEFAFTGVPPARYVVCAQGMIMGERSGARNAARVIWWANVDLAEGPAEVAFTADNGYPVRGIFLPW